MPGAPAGVYRVVVTEPMFPLVLPEKTPEDGGSPAPAIGIPTLEARPKTSIPAVYTDKENTSLRFTVPNEDTYDLQLFSKSK
jgi:hypothetical protein